MVADSTLGVLHCEANPFNRAAVGCLQLPKPFQNRRIVNQTQVNVDP
jgi:hypothetical protein